MQGRIFVYLALFDCRERLSWREDSTWKSDTVLTHISLTRITSSHPPVPPSSPNE